MEITQFSNFIGYKPKKSCQVGQRTLFEDAFKTEAGQLTENRVAIENLWKEIANAYSKKGRHYHNLAHLDNFFTELLQVKELIKDWQTIVFSIAYHDLIYNPLKQDNEERSAEKASNKLALINAPDDQRDKCRRQILATKGHQLSPDVDTNYFTDADLAILGSGFEEYDAYTRQIRKEYKYFPNLIYSPGRMKVLQHFLQMEKIFKTSFFADKYEKQARINLTRELKTLS